MVVDDDEDTRAELEVVLREEGYRVIVAHDGLDALERLRYGTRPDVILLDLLMPRMDGWAFRKAQLADPALSTIPVVLLSGARTTHWAVSELRAACAVPKPIRLEALFSAVARHAQSAATGPASTNDRMTLGAWQTLGFPRGPMN